MQDRMSREFADPSTSPPDRYSVCGRTIVYKPEMRPAVWPKMCSALVLKELPQSKKRKKRYCFNAEYF